MADKYVVAAGGNWSDAATWSLTDGGAGGAGAPSASENAYLSNQSGNLVVNSAATCLTLDFTKGTGYTGTFSGSATLSVAGSLAFSAGMTRSYTGIITFTSTALGNTITSNGKTFGNNITFNGVGGEWTLADALSLSAFWITLTAGTVRTNGKAVSCNVLTGAAGTAYYFGASAISLIAFYNVSSTIDCGTSHLTFGANGYIQTGISHTFYDVTFTSGACRILTVSQTFRNLTINGPDKTTSLELYASGAGLNITVTGTFTVAGSSAINRVLIRSNLNGTARTVTAAAVSLTNADFMDITGAGAAAPFSGTSMGDCGGNSGITFDASVTQTATGTASFTWSTHGWTTRVPLPQDDVVIPNAFVAGRTITADMPRLGRDITFTCTGNPTFGNNTPTTNFGSFTLSAGMAWQTANAHQFFGRGSHTVDLAGVTDSTTNGIIYFNAPGGSYTISSAMTLVGSVNSKRLVLVNGTFVFQGSLTVGSFFVSGGTSASVDFGSSTHTIVGSGTGAFVMNTGYSTQAVSGTGTIKFTDATATAKSFAGNGKTYNNVWFNNAGSGAFEISGANTFNQFKVDAGRTVRFTAATVNAAADWSFGSGCIIGSMTSAQHTLSKTGGGTVSVDGATISYSNASPANTFYAANSTDGGNNSGWSFARLADADLFDEDDFVSMHADLWQPSIGSLMRGVVPNAGLSGSVSTPTIVGRG